MCGEVKRVVMGLDKFKRTTESSGRIGMLGSLRVVNMVGASLGDRSGTNTELILTADVEVMVKLFNRS